MFDLGIPPEEFAKIVLHFVTQFLTINDRQKLTRKSQKSARRAFLTFSRQFLAVIGRRAADWRDRRRLFSPGKAKKAGLVALAEHWRASRRPFWA